MAANAISGIKVASAGHIGAAVEGILKAGWAIVAAPFGSKLRRNAQHLRLRWLNEDRAFRLFVYKVTDRGEQFRAAERRIEITSTYQKNLQVEAGYKDVVLGYDPATEVFVGIDPRRIDLGGLTGNASSNVSPDGLDRATDESILVLPHESNLLGTEYQAYFKADRISEYLANHEAIHSGSYDGLGPFSGDSHARARRRRDFESVGEELVLSGADASVKTPIWRDPAVWKAFEEGKVKRLRRKFTPIDFLELYRRQIEVGTKGELHVLKIERIRLIRLGRTDLADKISWVAKDRPYAGYDIKSYEADGSKRFIEVKATTGSGRRFDISANELSAAKDKGSAYFIYRVTSVESSPSVTQFQDPMDLIDQGVLTLTRSGWVVTY